MEPDEISFLDVTDLELNPMDAKNPVTPMKKQRLILNKMPSGKSASGIAVISKYQSEVMSQFKDINQLFEESDTKNSAYLVKMTSLWTLCLIMVFMM